MATRQELRDYCSNPVPNTKDPHFTYHVFDNMGSINYASIEVRKSEILRRPADREIPLAPRQQKNP